MQRKTIKISGRRLLKIFEQQKDTFHTHHGRVYRDTSGQYTFYSPLDEYGEKVIAWILTHPHVSEKNPFTSTLDKVGHRPAYNNPVKWEAKSRASSAKHRAWNRKQAASNKLAYLMRKAK